MSFNVKPKARAFNAGVWSPIMAGRSDLAKYAYACQAMENMLTRPQGPAFRRPGTVYRGDAKHHDKRGRLIKFVFNESQRYQLHFETGVIRLFTSDGIVLDGDSPYEIATPFVESDLRLIQTEQSHDVMFLTCPGVYPKKLSRYDHTSWAFEDNTYDDGPFRDENLDDAVTLAVNHITNGAENVDLVAVGADRFEAGHVGALFKLSHVRPEAFYSGSYAVNTTSTEFSVYGNWEFVTHGNWDAVMKIQKSYDGGTSWQDYKSYRSKMTAGAGDKNYAVTGEETDKNVLYRIKMISRADGTCEWDFSVADKIVSGVVRVTAVTDARHAVCTVVDSPYSTAATKRWCEGAWSAVRGYPRAIGRYKGRLVFGGTEAEPTRQDFTKAGDFSKLEDGVLDDDAIYYQLGDARQNPIYWMTDIDDTLLVGTWGSEHAVGKSGGNDPFNGTTIEAKRQSMYGSEPIQAVICNDVVLFVQKNGRILREMSYIYEKEGYDAADVTILSEGITASGIVEMAVQSSPYTYVWCLLANGQLAVMNYERSRNPSNDNNVVGWNPMIAGGGEFESISTNPGQNEDEVWTILHLIVNGQDRRYIVQFKPQHYDTAADAFFLDAGLTFDGGEAVAVSDITVADDPYRVTVTAAGLEAVDGQTIRFTGIDGMTWLNDRVLVVADQAGDSFVLKDTTGAYLRGDVLAAYTGGGIVRPVTTHLSGLDHLEGMTVSIMADGATYPDRVVTAGAIDLPTAASVVHAGLSYRSLLSPMPFEIPTQSGSSPSYTQRIYSLIVHFYRSMGVKVGPSLDQLDTQPFRSVSDPMDAAPPLFTGMMTIPFQGGYSNEGNLYLVQDEPQPMTILSIEPKMGVSAE